MAESQSGASSSVNPKKKTSLLDEDIGKDFFSSWKSMSVPEDDAMDFNFETAEPEKGKKKTFNFGKLNMDFTLDGDFDKISSFKVDMPDLDFSSPPKKDGKPKEKSDEKSTSASCQGKQDRFTFSFDFNELDDFDFDSSLKKGNKKSKKDLEDKGMTSDGSECQGSKTRPAKGVSADDDSLNTKLPASDSATTAKAENLAGACGDISFIADDPPSKSRTSGHLVESKGANTSPVKTGKQTLPPEKKVSTVPYAQKVIHDSNVQPVSGNDLIPDPVSDMHIEVHLPDTKVNTSSVGEESKSIVDLRSNNDISQFKNSPPDMTGSQSTLPNNHVSVENIDDSEPARGDLDLEDTSITNISRKMLQDTNNNKETQKSTSTLLLAPLSSEKETGSIHSKFFKRQEETESQLHQASSTWKKIISSDVNKIGTIHSCHADEKREVRKGEPVLPIPEKNVKDFNSIRTGIVVFSRDGSDAVGSQNRSKLGKSDLLGSEKNITDLITNGSQVNLSSSTEQITKPSTQKCVNPKLVVSSLASISNSKMTSLGGNKLTSLKAAKRTPELSTMKSLRSTGMKNDLSNTFQQEIKSLKKSEVQENSAFKTIHSIGSTPSLKRKTYEPSKADLNLHPLKRLSESPSESRNKETAKMVIEEQVNAKNSLSDHPISTLVIPPEVNMTELEVMENDRNVEKAEAYAKELEDICNMLKKKHEEAKELMVRAIVNNNKLLMLSHPIYEQKIRAVQKFAARLMSKEICT